MKSNQKRKYNDIEKVEVSKVYGDLAQEVIQITADKLKLILQQYLSTVINRQQWVAPAGILLTLAITFATTEIKELWLSADTWKAIFVLSTIGTIVWLLIVLFKIRKMETIDDLVERIKQKPKS